MRKAILTFLCAALAVLFIACPWMFLMQPRNRVVRKWLSGGSLSYEGELTVWAVDAGVGGKNALHRWLYEQSAAFKRRHFGVYPVIEDVGDMDEVRRRVQAGQCPDLLLCGGSVPKNVLDRAALYDGPFPMPLALTQREGGRLTPLMQSGAVVLINEDALYIAGLFPPEGMEGMQADWVAQTLNVLPGAFGYDDPLCLMAALAGDLPKEAQRALSEIRRRELTGKTLPGLAAYPLCGFAAGVQYALLLPGADESRDAAARAFLTSLVGNRAQSALADVYALPVVRGASCRRADLGALWLCAEQTRYIANPSSLPGFAALCRDNASVEELNAYVDYNSYDNEP